MNYSTAVMLINTNIRAIKTSYEVDSECKGKKPFTIYKTLDKDVSVGDLVVVPSGTRHGMTVVRIEEVDVDVDFEDTIEVKWVIGKIETDNFDRIIKEEEKWVEALKASEKRRKREEIKKNMLDMYQDDGIEKLPIANMSDTPMIEK